MSESKHETLARQPRYSVCNRQAIEVFIERSENHACPGAAAELLDLSVTGARVAVPVPVDADEAVRLRLLHSATGLDESVSARVKWVRPGRGRMWLAGCSFLDALSGETIDTLANLGCLDHDVFERSPVCGEATAWQQLKPSGVTVRLVDLSEGGLSLLSPNGARVGQRLRLVPHTGERRDADIIVRVRCCAALDQSFLLSCKFEHSGDYRLLCGTVRVPNTVRADRRLMKKLLRRSSLISRTTILLLGGMFVGLAVGVTQPRYAIIGLLSVVAYLGLELADEKRNRARHSKWSEFFEELLEQRLEEHHANLQNGWTARPLDLAHEPLEAIAVSNTAS